MDRKSSDNVADKPNLFSLKNNVLRSVVGKQHVGLTVIPVSLKPLVKCPATNNEGDGHCTQIEAAHISRLLCALMEPLPLPFASLEEGSMRLAEAPWNFNAKICPLYPTALWLCLRVVIEREANFTMPLNYFSAPPTFHSYWHLSSSIWPERAVVVAVTCRFTKLPAVLKRTNQKKNYILQATQDLFSPILLPESCAKTPIMRSLKQLSLVNIYCWQQRNSFSSKFRRAWMRRMLHSQGIF